MVLIWILYDVLSFSCDDLRRISHCIFEHLRNNVVSSAVNLHKIIRVTPAVLAQCTLFVVCYKAPSKKAEGENLIVPIFPPQHSSCSNSRHLAASHCAAVRAALDFCTKRPPARSEWDKHTRVHSAPAGGWAAPHWRGHYARENSLKCDHLVRARPCIAINCDVYQLSPPAGKQRARRIPANINSQP